METHLTEDNAAKPLNVFYLDRGWRDVSKNRFNPFDPNVIPFLTSAWSFRCPGFGAAESLTSPAHRSEGIGVCRSLSMTLTYLLPILVKSPRLDAGIGTVRT